MKKLEKLEAIRGFAAMYVVLHHLEFFDKIDFVYFGFDFSFLFTFGVEAVMIFFILSGFVIHYSFSRATDKSFKLFFYKRFSRVFIPLIAVFIATPILQYLQGGEIEGFKLSRLIGNLLMLQDLSFKTNAIVKPLFDNGPLWSLSYEWWYYMIYFAICTYVIKQKQSLVVYILILLATISCIFYPFAPNRWIMYMIVWWTGVELSQLYMDGNKISFKSLLKPLSAYALILLILGIGALLCQYEALNDNNVYNFYTLLSAFILLIIALIWHSQKWRFFKYTIDPFKHLASISYGIYISHMFLVIQATYLDFIENIYIRFTLYIAICFLFSYFIERILYVKINKFLTHRLFNKKKAS